MVFQHPRDLPFDALSQRARRLQTGDRQEPALPSPMEHDGGAHDGLQDGRFVVGPGLEGDRSAPLDPDLHPPSARPSDR